MVCCGYIVGLPRCKVGGIRLLTTGSNVLEPNNLDIDNVSLEPWLAPDAPPCTVGILGGNHWGGDQHHLWYGCPFRTAVCVSEKMVIGFLLKPAVEYGSVFRSSSVWFTTCFLYSSRVT